MTIDSKATAAGVILLAAMAWSSGASAQNSSWWGQHRDTPPPEKTSSQTVPQSSGQTQAFPAQHAGNAEAVGPGYTYIEGGATQLDVDMYGSNESGNGGYLRGSVAVSDNLYVFGGYDRATESWAAGTERLEVAIDQSEIGLGARVAVSRSVDFTSELSMLRLGARLDYENDAYPERNLGVRDHLYAGKFVLGLRGKPSQHTELWAKAGYVRVDDSLLVESSMVGNIGGQIQFNPVWGLVGEAEFYEDLRFYRLGIRARF